MISREELLARIAAEFERYERRPYQTALDRFSLNLNEVERPLLLEMLRAPAQRPVNPARETFETWFNRRFLDPDGGDAHLPDWLKDDLRSAWDAALSSTGLPAPAPHAEVREALLLRRLQDAQNDCMAQGQAAAAILLQDARVAIIRMLAGEWQSIETAPRDGTPILGYSTEGVTYVCWNRKGSWVFFKNYRGDEWHFNPTHWMPHPALPQQDRGGK